ncbi:MAG TPA: molybdenum cofactor guanylyltransferase [Archangium sp.]
MYGSHDTSVKPGGPPALVVLAGGRGRRLGGVPKGLIRLANGLTVVEQLLTLARGPAFVSANVSESYERFDVPVVGDLVPDKGAPGGVVTALAVAPTEWVFVVACDMPFVTRAMLDELERRRHPGADVVCFTREGKLEPLVGLYRRALCFDWALRLDGNPSLRELVDSVRVDTVESEQPHRLTSLNSPDDLRAAAESFRDPDDAGTLPALSW